MAQRGRRSFDGPPAEARRVTFDREAPNGLAGVIKGGVDAVIDTVAYDERHGRSLLEVQADVGAYVVISSASVYQDAAGRSLDEAGKTGFSELPEPISEPQRTVAAGPETYSLKHSRLARSERRLPAAMITNWA